MKNIKSMSETDLSKLDKEEYIKVNLPDSEENYQSGNGEGVWACPVDDIQHQLIHDYVVGSIVKVVVLNNCFYYPLNYGDIVSVIITNEKNRPILDNTTHDYL